jgi:pimeloyl-ACP methyl ester carboxylesterase
MGVGWHLLLRSIVALKRFRQRASLSGPVLLPVLATSADDNASLVDIIFVHGLAGDSHATWTLNKRDDNFWPRWVAEDISDVAVWTLGFPAERFGGTDAKAMALEDRAKSLLNYLVSQDLGKRPIIFVAHSLGGLLVKQILRTGFDKVDPRWEVLARAVRGVIFLATPHTGSNLADVAEVLGSILGPSAATSDLQMDGAKLRSLKEWYVFNSVLQNIETASYAESQAATLGPFRIGVIVTHQSAEPGIGKPTVLVDANHVSIVQPRGREDRIYTHVLSDLREWLSEVRGGEGSDKDLLGSAHNTFNHSRARCYALFRAAGLDENLSRSFVDDDTLGHLPDIQNTISDGGISLIVGGVGEGKSLGLERTLQRLAKQVIEHTSIARIFYVDATAATMEKAICDIHALSASGMRCALFIDNGDLAELSDLEKIVNELRGLNFEYPRTSIIMCSRFASALRDAPEVINMPHLEEAEVRRLFERIAPFANLEALIAQKTVPLGVPLFAILAALYYSNQSAGPVSPGDLLAFLAQKVLIALGTPGDSTVLRRLGSLQVDAAGELVALADVASTNEQIALINSGYVRHDLVRRSVGFALPILAQWFAAQALEIADISIEVLATDDLRLEKWREVFLLRISLASEAQIDLLFQQLIIGSAGFAASLANRVPLWFAYRFDATVLAIDYATRMRASMEAWLTALGALADHSPYADECGVYALGARIESDARLRLAWRKDRSSLVFELDDSISMLRPTVGYTATSYHRFADFRPAWSWTSSLANVGAFVAKVFDFRDYTSPVGAKSAQQLAVDGSPDQKELAWGAALCMLGRRTLVTEPLSITELVERGVFERPTIVTNGVRFFDDKSLRAVVSELLAAGDTLLYPPWPSPESSSGPWVWTGYSEDAILRRIKSVHEGALAIYERLVSTHFGHFARGMRLFSVMPLEFRVTVLSIGDTPSYEPPIAEWSVTPLEHGPNTVSVGFGKSKHIDEYRREYMMALVRRPAFSMYGNRLSSGRIAAFEDLPMTELAYQWLAADAKALFGK